MTPPARAPSSGARTRTLERFASDREVLELVARHALGVKLCDGLDRRHLRRLNSALGRYRLARAAAASTNRRERRTTRMAVATSLYGQDVELDDVRRQMLRVERDLAAAGLLEVEVLTTAGGRPRGIVERVLETEALGKRARARCRHVARRPETRRQAASRRVAPHRRQQSDRARRGGVPGAYVRAGDVELLERELPPRALAARRARDLRLGIARVGPASPLGGTGRRNNERDARQRARPPGASAAHVSPRERHSSTRSSGSPAPRNRWAALSRLRTAGTEREGPERLRRAAREGAPPCAVAAAAFEGRFVIDGPWSFAQGMGGPMTAPDVGAEPGPYGRTPFGAYRPISQRWAERLERYCAIHDRQTGRAGSGLLALLDDVLSWAPEHGAPRGARHDEVDLGGRRPTSHPDDPGWPASLAYFIARLGIAARRLRRLNNPRRAIRAAYWAGDQEDGSVRQHGRDPWLVKRQVEFGDDYWDELEAERESPESTDC